ncbi:ECF transporter S component [Paenibacillus sp. J2TS4]|uniref:ECF transporter S component n=1 Tax=Paenibacillus sp. J2TS4 TaxID=2807194 RepID=UPI001B157025|nr:ECF transporter S component [Paenibacillus sp. J2TS4]GIP34143.1 putative HMP/thiamine permease protein YkoE [Paenibacillus sp. J2TS4]
MKRWKLREVVVLAALSVVFAVVYLAFLQFGNVLVGLMGPIGYEFIFGIWFIVSIISAYIIRKPGAAFLSETMAAAIELLMGNVAGPRLLLSAMIQGLGAEAVFAATGWKRYSTWVLVCAGMGSAVFSFVWGFFVSGYAALNPGYVTAMFVIRLISGALLAGLLGQWVADGLAKTGVLRGFAIAKSARKKERHDLAG